MKIILDNSPAGLTIETPHGSIRIGVWPNNHTTVEVEPGETNSDLCLRSDSGTSITLKPRS